MKKQRRRGGGGGGSHLTEAAGSGRRGGLGGRDRGDCLQDLRGDLVGVPLRVRAAILEIALVAIVHEAVGNADGRSAVGDSVCEIVNRGRLVLPSEAHVVVRS